MRALLDVNVLIALFDVDHVFHGRAHDWWETNAFKGWASCPLTENGFVRVMSNPGYGRNLRLSPSDLISRLASFAANTDHVFWPDDVSFLDPGVFDCERLHGSGQIADTYLLALASRHGGRLATFDETIDVATVPTAKQETLCIIG